MQSHGFRCTGIVASVALACMGCAREGESIALERYGWHAMARGIAPQAEAVDRVSYDPDEQDCHAADNPWRGPGLCGPGAVLEPERGTCSVFNDMSPRIDPVSGFYRGEHDRGNFVATDQPSVLELLALYVRDNGEGENPPHGPHGHLYWDVFGRFERFMTSADGARARRIGSSHILHGPHRTHGTTDEWLDDEALMYSGAGLFKWGSEPGTEQEIVLRVWESDGSEDGNLGRRNDVLGMEHIRRADTEKACGVWVPFHRYTEGHPRQRTTETAVFMLLRTKPPEPHDTLLARLAHAKR